MDVTDVTQYYDSTEGSLVWGPAFSSLGTEPKYPGSDPEYPGSGPEYQGSDLETLRPARELDEGQSKDILVDDVSILFGRIVERNLGASPVLARTLFVITLSMGLFLC